MLYRNKPIFASSHSAIFLELQVVAAPHGHSGSVLTQQNAVFMPHAMKPDVQSATCLPLKQHDKQPFNMLLRVGQALVT